MTDPGRETIASMSRESGSLALATARAGYEAIQRELRGADTSSDIQIQADTGQAAQLLANQVRAAAEDPSAFSGTEVTSGYDAMGDPQISFDLIANREMEAAAKRYGAKFFSEEDEFRRQFKDAAPAERAKAIQYAALSNHPIIIADPLDGSHQCAAMLQPGGWGHAVMTLSPRHDSFVVVALGTGEAVATNNTDTMLIDLNELTHYESARILLSDEFIQRRHYKVTWVLPAYKPDRLNIASRIMEHAQSIRDDLRRPKLVAPLGGNPGVLSSLILAPAGAVAAYQPKSWAWDQFVFIVAASLGLPVATVKDGQTLTAQELTNVLYRDLANGLKSEAIVAGKTIEDMEAIRFAVQQSDIK